MNVTAIPDIERSIARCRLVLSLGALAAVFVDPTEPILTRWIPLTGGSFVIDPYALATLIAHLCYSGAMIVVVHRRLVPLGIRDRVELAIYAARVGLIGLHERSW